MRRLIYVIAATLGLVAPPLQAKAASAGEAEVCAACEAVLELALANPRRDADRARDVYRHPAETIAFFRIRPGMTVADVAPGGGWFTRVLVPYLGDAGRYIALDPFAGMAGRSPSPDFATSFPTKAAGWTGVPASRIPAFDSTRVPAALNGTVDRVLILREVHNFQRQGTFVRELATAHRLLKPSGLLGIEEHRAKADAPDAYVDGSKGYMREADVIAAITSHGFVLVARSEINSNPKDTADYPAGVWTLPPSYALKETDRARYQAIGESDRMTLLFRKRG
ncbi:MAG: methyltransferase [Novosphingobium sp.]